MEGLYAYKLAITAIMRNEGCNLEEWLNYHILAGVQHFFLYDNESTDNTGEILAPYIKAGWVTYQYFPDRPGENIQLAAYNQAVVQHRYDCEYMALIDLDEFIVPLEDKDIYSVIKEVTDGIPFAVALTMRWKIFGSSGVEKRPRSVIEAYLQRATDNAECNVPVKSIVNPRAVLAFTNPHSAWYYTGLWAVNDKGTIVTGPGDDDFSYRHIQLNHYFVKSKEDWRLKLSRGRADLPRDGKPPRSEEEYHYHDRNEIYDDRILKYIAAVKDRELEGGADISAKLAEFVEKGIDWYQRGCIPWKFEDFAAAGCLCLKRFAADKELSDYIDKLFYLYLEKVIKENQLKNQVADYCISMFNEQADRGRLLKSKRLLWQYMEAVLAEGKISKVMSEYYTQRFRCEVPDAYFLQ